MTTELNSILRQWLVLEDLLYVEQEHAEYRIFRFEVPVNEWNDDIMPARGTVTPVELGGVGTVLVRRVRPREIPGYVVCILICGWSGWNYFAPLTRVSCRQVTVREKLVLGSDGTTPLAGPVPGEEETQRYAVAGDEYHNATYVQINITSIVSSIPAGWQSSNFNSRNVAPVTIRGVTYATGKVLYVGGASEDVPASQSPTGVAAYRLGIVLLASPKVWPLTVTRHIETKKIVQLDVVDADGTKISDSRSPQWVRAAGAGTSVTIRGEFDMASAIASLP